MNFKTIPFTKINNDKLVSLFINVFEKEPWHDKWPSFKRAKAYLTDLTNTPGFRGFMLTDHEQIIGACFGYIMKWWQGNEYYLKEFYIDTNRQKQGCGSKLFDDMAFYLKNENIETIILLTERDVPAYDFYRQKGLNVINQSVFMVGHIK